MTDRKADSAADLASDRVSRDDIMGGEADGLVSREDLEQAAKAVGAEVWPFARTALHWMNRAEKAEAALAASQEAHAHTAGALMEVTQERDALRAALHTKSAP